MKNFQSEANKQGERWHKECMEALRRNGFEIREEKMDLLDVGIELDAITNNEYGLAMAWEFKGSWEGERQGLKRTDTMKKAIANAWLLSQSEDFRWRFPPLFVMTTHEPQDGFSLAMMQTALVKGLISYITDDRDNTFLTWLNHADDDLLYELIEDNRRRPMVDPYVKRGRKFPRHPKQRSTKIVEPILGHPLLFSVNGEELDE
jgi:hypothetical protein